MKENMPNDKFIRIIFLVGAAAWFLKSSSLDTVIIRLCIILLCLPMHECAHAFSAHLLGDDTAKNRGRMTLSPFAHLNFYGTLFMLLFGFGFANPVPVSMASFPPEKWKKYYALTALAGPLSNLFLSLLLLGLARLSYPLFHSPKLLNWLALAAYINISLAIFNLLPIPPLDGSSLLGLILPGNAYYKLYRYQRYFMLGIFALIILLGQIGISPVSYLTGKVYNFFVDILF